MTLYDETVYQSANFPPGRTPVGTPDKQWKRADGGITALYLESQKRIPDYARYGVPRMRFVMSDMLPHRPRIGETQ